ncbi:prephenate/arogenate dehydrogenase family protein [Acuticoccus sp. I52.16.1]|uniref:prephenate/arogenate dehydrogenase family protein n=1 Tax=Acuticoccus sp. I52.16.1 TaxID=2928472 RepID=UPI001FD33F3A|nr:prephenate/arogenate dehydrogenase family protein [Acuticoccus sp. I52.16.1]UOM36074.1 prephenate/arogenate dehydrogenase family protein [Acuticoccus sp. I52.16.1]
MADGEQGDAESGFFFNSVAILGIGLIGSSIALALRDNGFEGPISIADRNGESLREAGELGLGNSYHTSAAKAVQGADVVFLCVPVGAMGATARAIAPTLGANAIVTDTGSVKASVARAVCAAIPNKTRFVPGHPIAGSEQSGPRAGWATLFRNRWSILTPGPETDAGAIDVVAAMWRKMGAYVELMEAEHHDLVLAITSHVPHLIAYNIVRTAYDMEAVTESDVIKFSAGGFRDFTRLAASDPTMWRDVFLNNKPAVIETLGRFMEDLAMLQRAIRWSDGEQLFDMFQRTRNIRMSIVEAGQDTAAPDFGRPRTAADRPGAHPHEPPQDTLPHVDDVHYDDDPDESDY